MTLTLEEARQEFDRCSQFVGYLHSELSVCDWTRLAEDGTLSYITTEILRLRRHLLWSYAATLTNEERHLTFEELLRSARKKYPATFETVLASYFRKNFVSPETSKEIGRKAVRIQL